MTKSKILDVIEKYNMISTGDTVIAAVSGGADSMCMLNFFNEFSRIRSFNLIAAHVNHGIRGTEADRDENFVKDFCDKNGIKFVVKHVNVPEISKTTGESEEQCGRRIRYEFFSEINSSAKVATAHNLNDCMETFLFNLARGTGLKGLTGIPAVRGNIIRPLIECTRDEIEEYLAENGISHITDSTNLCDEYSRNKIRHNVIPVLNEINPSFPEVFLNCISTLSDAEKYLEYQTDKIFSEAKNGETFDISIVKSADKAVRDRLLIKIAEYYSGNAPEYKHINAMSALLNKNGGINLIGNVTVMSDCKKFYVRSSDKSEDFCYDISENKKEYAIGNCIIVLETVDKNSINIYNNKKLSNHGYIDADCLKNAVFRNRRSGDRFRYSGAEHSKSLKNLFSEKKIDADKRSGIIILADDENILWIDGFGTSDYAKVTDKTDNIVKISINKT